jgi:hypothetical protein
MSGFGYQPKHIHLLDSRLTLDPQIAAAIAKIQARIAARDCAEPAQGRVEGGATAREGHHDLGRHAVCCRVITPILANRPTRLLAFDAI